jgi:2-keto-4-pentenoate hydratase/2-oxohepta-3-ene-1,7-dioic acid hydratase in catechol pathway
MRIARFWLNDEARYGVVEGPELRILDGHPLVNGYEYTGDRVAMKEVKLLAPTVPSKIVCIGKNYAAHAAEIGEEVPDEPLIFFKPSTAIVGPGDSIVLPWQSEHVDLECELTVVIGRITKNIEPEEVDAHIWGFTIANDVTARDLQFEDGQWARSKGFDTFCPLGPWIETDFDVESATLESRINGEVIQHADTTDMVFNIREIVSHVSKNMTLLPGDIILTGSPAGITPIKTGDIIECEIEGIGTLLNPVQ